MTLHLKGESNYLKGFLFGVNSSGCNTDIYTIHGTPVHSIQDSEHLS